MRGSFMIGICLALAACGGGGGGATLPVLPSPSAFISWSSTPSQQPMRATAVTDEVIVTTDATGTTITAIGAPAATSTAADAVVTYGINSGVSNLISANVTTAWGTNGVVTPPPGAVIPAVAILTDLGLASQGVRYVDYALDYYRYWQGERTHEVIVANPYRSGWDYQTFGVWRSDTITTLVGGGSTFRYGAFSTGAPTPDTSIPTSGVATFNGKLAGIYVSPAGVQGLASSDVSLNVNFAARTLALSSTATTVSVGNLIAFPPGAPPPAPPSVTTTAAPNLNLAGTLTYAAQTNSFRGTLTSAGGTLSGSSTGRFYGPTAQELGGTFALRAGAGLETYIGGYGAKR